MVLRRRARQPQQRLFSLNYPRYARFSRRRSPTSSSVSCGVRRALRHGGPSTDSDLGGRDLAAIQRRGPWASAGSAKRHEEHERFLKQLNVLGVGGREARRALVAPIVGSRVLAAPARGQMPVHFPSLCRFCALDEYGVCFAGRASQRRRVRSCCARPFVVALGDRSGCLAVALARARVRLARRPAGR